MSVLRTEKLNKNLYINKIKFILILLIILFNFSADRPIKNPEGNYDTASFSTLVHAHADKTEKTDKTKCP